MLEEVFSPEQVFDTPNSDLIENKWFSHLSLRNISKI